VIVISEVRFCAGVFGTGPHRFLKNGATAGFGEPIMVDVKEYYFYLTSTPVIPTMKYLYKYPQAQFPYSQSD